MRKILLILSWLALPSVALAQGPTDYVAKYYNVGAPSPVQTEAFQAAAVSCNQVPPSATASTVNPTKISWDDPANAGRACIYTAPTGAPLLSVPFGAYEGTLTANNAAGAGVESPRVPFSRLAAPSVLTGLRYTR